MIIFLTPILKKYEYRNKNVEYLKRRKKRIRIREIAEWTTVTQNCKIAKLKNANRAKSTQN